MQPPHGAEFFIKEKPRVKPTEDIDWCATLNIHGYLVSTLCESILIWVSRLGSTELRVGDLDTFDCVGGIPIVGN